MEWAVQTLVVTCWGAEGAGEAYHMVTLSQSHPAPSEEGSQHFGHLPQTLSSPCPGT